MSYRLTLAQTNAGPGLFFTAANRNLALIRVRRRSTTAQPRPPHCKDVRFVCAIATGAQHDPAYPIGSSSTLTSKLTLSPSTAVAVAVTPYFVPPAVSTHF